MVVSCVRRQAHLNKLVCTAGVVTRRTNVFPQLQRIKFDCTRCGYVLGPFFQNTGEAEVKPNSCPQCQGKGPFNVRISSLTPPFVGTSTVSHYLYIHLRPSNISSVAQSFHLKDHYKCAACPWDMQSSDKGFGV